MARRRFFVDHFEGNTAVMEGDAAHHLGNVLRAQPGQLYELSDGSTAWLARIDSVARNRVEFTLLEQLPAQLDREREAPRLGEGANQVRRCGGGKHEDVTSLAVFLQEAGHVRGHIVDE